VHSSLHNPQPEYFDEGDSELEGMKSLMRYDGNFICKNEQMSVVAEPLCYPIQWYIEGKEYYSIPKMKIRFMDNGKEIEGEGWLDHEQYLTPLLMIKSGNWDWLALKLFNGIDVMGYKDDKKSYGAVVHDDIVHEEVIVITDNIYLKQIGCPLVMKPIADEKIFRPQVGIKYSEQPQRVFCDGKEIGYGMRERTYGGIKVEEDRLWQQ
jgi:hypothetical protein